MLHPHGFEAVDRTLKDILELIKKCSKNCAIDGKLFVLKVNFRKTLPIVPKEGEK